ncbi:TIR domain-containing protein [Bacillus sp. ChL18]|uniref:SEFIR domain-containing protein n=1 Tax=Bacillus TaxID=1386 RepID=UPI0022492739|nr:SEFIR domain-containing protein [Bacillus sp. ChL18]MCX2809619.1 TIR domain-containing protein [Bacillus sp. ChL18]
MNNKTIRRPKVFISYCWTSPEHEEWVLDLAIRLSEGNGIEVVLDKWDLKEGQDKYAFMESMVTSEEIDRVLIICDSGYQIKADKRTGGVGDETQIITPNVYSDTNQEKFIPIVAERDKEGNAFIPAYVKNRIYIDLSKEETFEENYETLLRNIMKAPKYKKPPLGELPLYLFKEEVNHFKTSHIIKQMRNALERNPERLKVMAIKFQDDFLESVESLLFTIEDPENLDDEVRKGIDKSMPLKDDFIQYIEILIEADKLKAEYLIDFFEKMFTYTKPLKAGSFYPLQFDHIKFLIHEIVLYTFLYLIKYDCYAIIAELLDADYNIDVPPYSGRDIDLTVFRQHLQSLENRNSRLGLQKINLQAEILIERAGKHRQELVNADILLYYFLELRDTIYDWFPITFIYKENENIRFLQRLKSQRFAEKVKYLFNAKDIEEMKDLLRNFENNIKYGFRRLSNPTHYINVEEIGTKN